MDFYLVRHGEALPEAADPRRPLSRLGETQVERVAQSAVARKARVSAILHSGILRAQQTAEIIARCLLPPAGVRRITGLLPEDDPAIAAAELAAAPESIMLVGHLPHMNRLAALLIKGDPDREAVKFAPATLLCVSREATRWTPRWTFDPEFAEA